MNKKIGCLVLLFWLTTGCVERRQSETAQDGSLFKKPHPACGLREGKFYAIKRKVDGDTFWLDDSCGGVKVRLIGIDAPETKDELGNSNPEPFGNEASAFMTTLLANQKVRVEFDLDSFDRHGRTLTYCYTEDGVFINIKMVEEGYARMITVQPNVKYVDQFINAQKTARKNKKGMWSSSY